MLKLSSRKLLLRKLWRKRKLGTRRTRMPPISLNRQLLRPLKRARMEEEQEFLSRISPSLLKATSYLFKSSNNNSRWPRWPSNNNNSSNRKISNKTSQLRLKSNLIKRQVALTQLPKNPSRKTRKSKMKKQLTLLNLRKRSKRRIMLPPRTKTAHCRHHPITPTSLTCFNKPRWTNSNNSSKSSFNSQSLISSTNSYYKASI